MEDTLTTPVGGRPSDGAVAAPLSDAIALCLVRHGETDWNREGRLGFR